MPDPSVLLLVIDGVGVSRERTAAIVREVWTNLPRGTRDLLQGQAASVLERQPASELDPGDLARLSVYPVFAGALQAETPFPRALDTLSALRQMHSAAEGTRVHADIRKAIVAEATRSRYIPWTAHAPNVRAIWSNNLTVPTSAAGVWAGYEPMTPPVQGNSETGHQQIGNLRLALQTPLEISISIADGSFFTNHALRAAVDRAVASGNTLNFCFLLSGTTGSDGRVHSAWNHLEAFLKLTFQECRADPARVRMMAILDGRDCPGTASIVEEGGIGAYIDRLHALLATFNAEESLAWIIGRGIAMDRDYREPNVRDTFLMLTRARGERVRDFKAAKRFIAGCHSRGVMDTEIPPVILAPADDHPPTIEPGQAFVDLNFRPDRQRALFASLLGARPFLENEARSRDRTWSFDWMNPDLHLDMTAIAEYHPIFSATYRVPVAYPTRPLEDNLLSIWDTLLPGERYLLVAESNKSAHMGYFIRGRRENPQAAGSEDRTIIPSFGEAEGILNDSDFYKTPAMRNNAIADFVVAHLAQQQHRLICVNLSNCDMIGHLLPGHFEEATRAYEAMDAAVGRIIPIALANHYSVILTADHGNIEDDTSAHSSNDVLTTIISPDHAVSPARRETFQARLFDLSWTIGRILGVERQLRTHVERHGPADYGDPFMGRPIASLDDHT